MANTRQRYESAIFAAYVYLTGLIHDEAVATPKGGHLLCAAYERFVSDVPDARMGIRRAMTMVGLLREQRLVFRSCRATHCYGVYVTAPDEVGSKCPHCDIARDDDASRNAALEAANETQKSTLLAAAQA